MQIITFLSLIASIMMLIIGYGAVVGMRIGRGNRSTWKKPAPLPFYLPQIPHDVTWYSALAAAVGN
jgi:hypothetical protein